MNEDRALEVEGWTREGSPETAAVDGGRETEGVDVVWRRELMGACLDKREGGALAIPSSPPFLVTVVFSLSSVKSTTALSAGGGRRVVVEATLPAVRDW